jgi:hypothetical protein
MLYKKHRLLQNKNYPIHQILNSTMYMFDKLHNWKILFLNTSKHMIRHKNTEFLMILCLNQVQQNNQLANIWDIPNPDLQKLFREKNIGRIWSFSNIWFTIILYSWEKFPVIIEPLPMLTGSSNYSQNLSLFICYLVSELVFRSGERYIELVNGNWGPRSLNLRSTVCNFYEP